MKRLSEGAEARLFETSLFGMDAVVKVRHEKKYRIKALDRTLRRTRTRSEARLTHKAFRNGVRTPRIIGLGEFSIYMERLRGKLLRDCKLGVPGFIEIGAMLARMHNAGIVHGDFTPANIMLCGRRLYVIDFGLSGDNGNVEEKAIDLLLIKRSVPKESYAAVSKGYASAATNPSKIIARLAEIEKRGRYQVRTLAQV